MFSDFSFIDPKLLGSAPFPPPHPSVRWFHSFVIHLDCFVTFYIQSRDIQPLKNIYFNFYALRSCLCALEVYGFLANASTIQVSTITSWYIIVSRPETVSCFTYSARPRLKLLVTVDLFHHSYSFTFSKLPYN